MSLSGYPVRASTAVSDLARSRAFYEGKLCLRAGEQPADDSRLYVCAGGTPLHVYTSAATAGTSTATLATWEVANLERVVDELVANGVRFERYDEPLQTDPRGSTPSRRRQGRLVQGPGRQHLRGRAADHPASTVNAS